jgi:hypothetical protein
MKYQIAHWYGQRPPIPEAILVEEADAVGARFYPKYEVEVEDLHKFVEQYGPIILKKLSDNWIIYVTDGSGRFGQRQNNG